jgi:hypothetical protein
MVGMQRHRFVRARTCGIVGFLACLVVGFGVWKTSSTRAKQYAELLSQDAQSAPVVRDEETELRIEAFCGDCHAMPRAESIPRDAWHDAVVAGYTYYARSGRNDLEPPPMRAAVAYYRSRAPEQLVFSKPDKAATELGTTFVVENLPFEPVDNIPPANSHLRWARLDPDADPVLLTCDFRYGGVAAVDLRNGDRRPRMLAQLNNPCHVEPCDLDGDQAIDLVVVDAGTEFGLDHDLGRVVWLRRQAAGDSYEEIVLASGLGRPDDVRPADLDGDGDLDLLVADFGAFETGKIILLENVGVSDGRPRFTPEVLDTRPGTIHVPIHDFNQDGRPDFVALVTQEYEQVEIFMNQGAARFNRHRLWAAPDLTFGSSGIELSDLDQDGDMDILLTNGDLLVSDYANPSHGVQWLENLGDLQFAYHRLTDLPGAYRALAADVDLDGDLDIIAVATFFQEVRPARVAQAPFASIVCLEQTSPGDFLCHTLETGFPHHLTLEIADFDNDGDLDFATGSFFVQERRVSHWLAIWWNQVIVK